MRPFALFLATVPCLLPACVPYRPDPASPERAVAASAVPPSSPLTFEEAVRFAIEHDPDLLALRARAAAVNPRRVPEPIEAMAGTDMEHRPEAGLVLDATSLLGIGPSSADAALARARRAEAWMRHHERAWEVAADVAEAFAVQRALEGLEVPDVALAAEAYVAAGLEPAVSRSLSDATAAETRVERAAIEAERTKNLLRLRRLLGATPSAALTLSLPPADWPSVETPTPLVLLRSRADLQRGLAAWETADAEFRKKVKAQIPSVTLSPSWSFDDAWLFGSVGLKLPIGAPGEARAAEAAREAARQDLAGLVLDALRDARTAREEAGVAALRSEGARTRAKASREAFDVARVRLEAGGAPFLEAAMAAESAVSAAGAWREAAMEEARARVRAARAGGWPATEGCR